MNSAISNLRRAAFTALAAGVVASAATVMIGGSQQFFRSYLTVYLLCLGIVLGCLGIQLVYALTGGAWGRLSLPILQAANATLPGLAVLFLPILGGLKYLYPWMDPSVMAGDSLTNERMYFSLNFFLGRAAFYFAAWCWMAWRIRRTSNGAGGSLVVYVLTVSFASFDWIMSLQANWSSAIYGLMINSAFWLSAFAFIILMQAWSTRRGVGPALPVETSHDLGNLLLGFVMIWTYTMLSQFLIMWSGNIPDEIRWYLARNRGGWKMVTVTLLLSGFALPFALLLFRWIKRELRVLAWVAGWVLASCWLNTYWLTVPDWFPAHLSFHAMDLWMILMVGGGWFALFCLQYGRQEGL